VASGGYYVEVTRTFTRSVEFGSDSTWTWSGNISTKLKSHTVYKERIPTSVSVIPQIRLRLDEFKFLDLIALIFQRTGFR